MFSALWDNFFKPGKRVLPGGGGSWPWAAGCALRPGLGGVVAIRAASGILFGNWDVSSQWTPLYLSACGVLLAALILFFLWALWSNHKRKKGN